MTPAPGRALLSASSFFLSTRPSSFFRTEAAFVLVRRMKTARCPHFSPSQKETCIMKRYLAEHWDTVLCIGLSILLAVVGVLAYFWMFPSE